jgi:hypothetical protein
MIELSELTIDRGKGREVEVGVGAPTDKALGNTRIYTNGTVPFSLPRAAFTALTRNHRYPMITSYPHRRSCRHKQMRAAIRFPQRYAYRGRTTCQTVETALRVHISC